MQVMRAQQVTIAKLLSGFELVKCRAEAHASKIFGTISEHRRESMDATIQDAQFYRERCCSCLQSYLLKMSKALLLSSRFSHSPCLENGCLVSYPANKMLEGKGLHVVQKVFPARCIHLKPVFLVSHPGVFYLQIV